MIEIPEDSKPKFPQILRNFQFYGHFRTVHLFFDTPCIIDKYFLNMTSLCVLNYVMKIASCNVVFMVGIHFTAVALMTHSSRIKNFVLRQVPAYESDTTALLRNLHASSDKDGVEHVLKTMDHIHGPWAFVYYQVGLHQSC